MHSPSERTAEHSKCSSKAEYKTTKQRKTTAYIAASDPWLEKTASSLPERTDTIVTLTFNDPERLNPMTQALAEVFARQVENLKRDPDVRAVILTGAGRAFSAGGDLQMLQEHAEQAGGNSTGRQRVR